MFASQPDESADSFRTDVDAIIEECDTKLARYRTALEAGTDPKLVARWTAEVQAEKAQALARLRKTGDQHRMSQDEIANLVDALGNIRTVLADANPADKAQVYRHLGLKLTYHPGKRTLGAEIVLDAQSWGYGACPRGGLKLRRRRGGVAH